MTKNTKVQAQVVAIVTKRSLLKEIGLGFQVKYTSALELGKPPQFTIFLVSSI